MSTPAQFGQVNISDGSKVWAASGNISRVAVETVAGLPITIKTTIMPTTPLSNDNSTAVVAVVQNFSTRTAMKTSTVILPDGSFEIVFDLDAAGDDFKINWCAGHYSALSGTINGTF